MINIYDLINAVSLEKGCGCGNLVVTVADWRVVSSSLVSLKTRCAEGINAICRSSNALLDRLFESDAEPSPDLIRQNKSDALH
ncbi:hypothetical protein TNCV_871631 [Trichonephila clavipes]|nr:hypothetical protein TNCV_871631 [Trichonephila clavipes]